MGVDGYEWYPEKSGGKGGVLSTLCRWSEPDLDRARGWACLLCTSSCRDGDDEGDGDDDDDMDEDEDEVERHGKVHPG